MWVENEAPIKETLEDEVSGKERVPARRAGRVVVACPDSRFKYHADPEGRGCPKTTNTPSSKRRYQHGFPGNG
jgi:hypothetical protein